MKHEPVAASYGPTEGGDCVADEVVEAFARRVEVGGLCVAGCRLGWTLWLRCVSSLQGASPLVICA